MVSIIILTLNSKKYIKPCLDSVFSQDHKQFEVIVVDNGSKDDASSLILNSYPQVRLITNTKNAGACSARNQGIEIAQGEWVLTLDCDVVLAPSFLGNIIRSAEKAGPETGIFQPKILQSGKKTIYSCGIHLSASRRFYDIGRDKPDGPAFGSQKPVFGACSAAAMYRRKCLDSIKADTGYFDERFFFLVEDVDLAWRAQNKGWKALFFPQAFCYHTGNSSMTSKRMRQYLCFRNRYYSILKNDNIMHLGFYLLYYDFPRIVFLLMTNAHVRRAAWKIILTRISDFVKIETGNERSGKK